jgi:uncharacterized protein YjiS (DUF1127 family)
MLRVNTHHSSMRRAADHPSFGLGNPLGFIKLVLERRKHMRELNYLLGLSDYQLHDVGLQRGDIQREAIRPIWRA